MNKNSHIILGIFLIIFNIGVVVWEFNHYTNKADKAVRTAYITLAEKLKVNAPNEENCYSNITISVNDDVLRLVNSKYTSDDFEKFLVAHYDAQTFWLNTWMGATPSADFPNSTIRWKSRRCMRATAAVR